MYLFENFRNTFYTSYDSLYRFDYERNQSSPVSHSKNRNANGNPFAIFNPQEDTRRARAGGLFALVARD